MNTGLRRGELLKLRWTSIDLDHALLTVEGGNAKSGQTHHVPLNEGAVSGWESWREQLVGRRPELLVEVVEGLLFYGVSAGDSGLCG
ncbi:MAG: tyrosine-type recombinase/integrase [Steroidobacteraceae bacterium]